MIASAHLDGFARDNLPPRAQWPDFLFTLPELNYPDRMNCVVELLDRWVDTGHGERPCLIAPTQSLTYSQLAEQVNRIANVLTRRLGLVSGNRVLLRGPNSPMMVAAWLAVIKAGGVVVATMPLLRAREIAYPLNKAKIALALCDVRLAEEMEKARPLALDLGRVVYWGTNAPNGTESLMTGAPKRTMHCHREMLATCDSYGRHVLCAQAFDRFIGSPPLAFTFGLGGLVLFPLRMGAATILPEKTAPDDLLAGIGRFGATIAFTAPTAYRAMLGKLAEHDISTLRKC